MLAFTALCNDVGPPAEPFLLPMLPTLLTHYADKVCLQIPHAVTHTCVSIFAELIVECPVLRTASWGCSLNLSRVLSNVAQPMTYMLCDDTGAGGAETGRAGGRGVHRDVVPLHHAAGAAAPLRGLRGPPQLAGEHCSGVHFSASPPLHSLLDSASMLPQFSLVLPNGHWSRVLGL